MFHFVDPLNCGYVFVLFTRVSVLARRAQSPIREQVRVPSEFQTALPTLARAARDDNDHNRRLASYGKLSKIAGAIQEKVSSFPSHAPIPRPFSQAAYRAPIL
jgi:hypothetical protein